MHFLFQTTAAVALYGICTQQYSPDGMFKKQCYSSSALGIVGFHSAVSVKPGISAETVFSPLQGFECIGFLIHVGSVRPGHELS